MSKGSKRRPEDTQRFREGYDRVFPHTPEVGTRESHVNTPVGPPDFCRDPKNCNGSCRMEYACND